jgi:hypothetical protein
MLQNKTTVVVALFCLIKLTLHLVADYNSGFQGDELLHIATGNHPALGYMEFPPIIGWLAFVQNQFHSSSVFVHHLFTHLAALLIMVLLALTTRALGGGPRAVAMVLLCVLVAPTFGRSQQLFQPVVLSQLFWVLAFYQLVRFVRTVDVRYLWYLTLALAAGFLAKYDIVFFIAGLAGLLLFDRTRAALLTRSSLYCALTFLLLISPNVWWQLQHQLPVLSMFSRLYETQLNQLTPASVLKDLVLSLNPITAVIWLGGAWFMLTAPDARRYRPLALTILLSLALLALAKSKAYYFYPVMLTLFTLGAVWFEQRVLGRRPWALYPLVGLLLLSGTFLVPFGLDLMPVASFIKFSRTKPEHGRYPVHYQEYYAPTKWPATLTALKAVYDSLPAPEKQHCLIWGKHYSQAGGVNLYRGSYGLPAAWL